MIFRNALPPSPRFINATCASTSAFETAVLSAMPTWRKIQPKAGGRIDTNHAPPTPRMANGSIGHGLKKLVARGAADEATAYVDHIIEQAGYILRTQDVTVLMTTPPLLQAI